MNMRILRCMGVVGLAAIGMAACAKSPVAPAGAASVAAPVSSSPASGAVIANVQQPVTLVVSNGLVTGGAAATYTFEVATDAAFSAKVTAKDVPQSTTGQTSVALDPLPAGKDYYWHVRASGGGTTGSFTSASKFTIGPAVTLGPPTPIQPANGATSTTLRPTFVVQNVARTGSPGSLVYRFDIATSAAFSSIVASATVPEGAGSTSFTPASDLTADVTYFWRAQAFDSANNVTSAFSASQSLVTVLTIDLRTVNYQRFVNISSWPVTNQITSVDQDGGDGHMCVGHAKSGLWPTSDFFNDPAVQVEGNQWYFARINGQWYGGSGEWLRKGQTCKSGQFTENIGPDGTWGGPMDTWRPKVGELVGYVVTTPARDYPNFKTLDERSQVVIMPWRDSRVASTTGVKR